MAVATPTDAYVRWVTERANAYGEQLRGFHDEEQILEQIRNEPAQAATILREQAARARHCEPVIEVLDVHRTCMAASAQGSTSVVFGKPKPDRYGRPEAVDMSIQKNNISLSVEI